MRGASLPLAMRGVLGLALLAASGIAPAQIHAQTRSGGVIQIGWYPNGKPEPVEFSTGDFGSRRFQDKGDHYLGKLPDARIAARHDFTIQWSGMKGVTLRVRPRGFDAPAGTEAFRIRKPNPVMPCNVGDVGALRQQALVAGRDNQLSTMIQIIAVLRQTAAPCSRANRAYLANLMFSLNQRIAQDVESVIFDFSPDVVALYQDIHRGNNPALQRLAKARQSVAGSLAEPALATLKRLQDGEDLLALDQYLTQLISAAGDGEFTAALAERKVRVADLRAMRSDSPVRVAVAGPKWFGVKPVAATTVVRDDAVIAASDLIRDAAAGVPDKDIAAQTTANDTANETAKDPAELLSVPGVTQAVDPAATFERAVDPLGGAVTSPGPDRALDPDVITGATRVEEAAEGAGGPG